MISRHVKPPHLHSPEWWLLQQRPLNRRRPIRTLSPMIHRLSPFKKTQIIQSPFLYPPCPFWLVPNTLNGIHSIVNHLRYLGYLIFPICPRPWDLLAAIIIHTDSPFVFRNLHGTLRDFLCSPAPASGLSFIVFSTSLLIRDQFPWPLRFSHRIPNYGTASASCMTGMVPSITPRKPFRVLSIWTQVSFLLFA